VGPPPDSFTHTPPTYRCPCRGRRCRCVWRPEGAVGRTGGGSGLPGLEMGRYGAGKIEGIVARRAGSSDVAIPVAAPCRGERYAAGSLRSLGPPGTHLPGEQER